MSHSRYSINNMKNNIDRLEKGVEVAEGEEKDGMVTFDDLEQSNNQLQNTRTTHTALLGGMTAVLALVVLIVVVCFCFACKHYFMKLRLMGRRIDEVGRGAGGVEEGGEEMEMAIRG